MAEGARRASFRAGFEMKVVKGMRPVSGRGYRMSHRSFVIESLPSRFPAGRASVSQTQQVCGGKQQDGSKMA